MRSCIDYRAAIHGNAGARACQRTGNATSKRIAADSHCHDQTSPQARKACCSCAVVHGLEGHKRRCCYHRRRSRRISICSCCPISFRERLAREGVDLIAPCGLDMQSLPACSCEGRVKVACYAVDCFARRRPARTQQGLLQRLSCLLKVYESMKGYRLQGSGVAVSANAQHALEAIHPDLLARQVQFVSLTATVQSAGFALLSTAIFYRTAAGRPCRFKLHGALLEGSSMYDLKGKATQQFREFGKETEKLEQKYGKRPFVLGWHEIRQLLYEHLPPDLVDFDRQVSNCKLHICRTSFSVDTHTISSC